MIAAIKRWWRQLRCHHNGGLRVAMIDLTMLSRLLDGEITPEQYRDAHGGRGRTCLDCGKEWQ